METTEKVLKQTALILKVPNFIAKHRLQPTAFTRRRDLNVRVPPESTGLILERLEADELWSFVGKKKNQVWVWLAMDSATRQVVAGTCRRSL